MPLTWNWNNKMGEVTYRGKRKDGTPCTYKENIYQGNCLCVTLYEYKDGDKEMYQLAWFLGDEQHLKNLLKNDPNFFADVKSAKLNLYYKQAETLQRYLVRLGIRVTAYYKEPKQPKQNKSK